MPTDYNTDFYAWAGEQAALLRAGRFSQLDIEHVAEEIEDLGKRERRALESRLGVLLGHLLKWRYQRPVGTFMYDLTLLRPNTPRTPRSKQPCSPSKA